MLPVRRAIQFHKSSHAFSSSRVGLPLYGDFSLNLFWNWTSWYSTASNAGAVDFIRYVPLPSRLAGTYTKQTSLRYIASRSEVLMYQLREV